MDAWQAALEDVGPAGVDKGKGGKYLILPPGYQGHGAGRLHRAAVRQPTRAMPCCARSSRAAARPTSPAAVAYGKRIKLYPLVAGGQSARDDFLDAIDVVYDATIPYDLRFFQSLDRFVQREPWLARDKAMIDPLKSIGIEKGKPFNPDAKTQGILECSGARSARLAGYAIRDHVHALFRRHAGGRSRRRPR